MAVETRLPPPGACAVLEAMPEQARTRVLCWRIFRGSRALLAIVVGFDLANATMFFAALPGPEELLPHRPLLLPLLVLAQIATTLVLTGVFARRGRPLRRADPAVALQPGRVARLISR